MSSAKFIFLCKQIIQEKNMSRIRLNQELRNKIGSRMRVGLEQEDTQEKRKFFDLRNSFKELQDKSWKLAETIVRRQYPQEDIDTCYYIQNKYDNVNTIAPDSCFHFGYMAKQEGEEEDSSRSWSRQHGEQDDKYITKHFDFKIDGAIDGVDRQDDERDFRSQDFAYAYFRDDLKGQENCNPDINIEMKDKQSNPHQTKFQDANNKFLGTYSSSDDGRNRFAREWNDEYKLDLIGREYCRDRQIPCSKQEFDQMIIWQQAKGQLIMAHEKWIGSVLSQMAKIKVWLKSWKYLDEALDFSAKAGCPIDEAEIIRCNSTGLAIFNPQNCADYLKGMKNKNISREQKIADRILYEKNAQSEVVN